MKKILNARTLFRNINVPLLIFLILFFNVKFVIKVVAILAITIYNNRGNYKFKFSWKQSRLPLFYSLTIVIEIIKYLLVVRNYSLNYTLVFGLGMLQWLMCLLSLHYLKSVVEKESTLRIHSTIRTFFFLNFLVSMFFLILLVFFPSLLTYWGHGADISFSHPSAGDAILGITLDASTVNATLNSIGLIYFIYKKDYLFMFICLLIIALCTSNVTFLLSIVTLAAMILTVRSNKLRWRTLATTAALTILYFLISPHNREYVRNYFIQLYILNKNPELVQDQIRRNEEAKDSAAFPNAQRKSARPPDSVYAFSKDRLGTALDNLLDLKDARGNVNDKSDSAAYLAFSEADYRSKPGKLISVIQTLVFLKSNKKDLLFGSGVGNFSSKLAFRTSGVNILGTYPKKYVYTHPAFKYNHLKTFLYYYNREASQHSVMNYPFSVYNQIAGEYGLIGILTFIIFYLGYFVKRFRFISYGKYMLVALAGFFVIEYWFEFFSLIVLIELFLLLNIEERRQELSPTVTTN